MSRRLAHLACLLTVGVGLQWVENALALPSPLPGAKLGLANVATLLVLARYGPRTAGVFGLLRHLVASLLTGSLLLPTFWLGMAGSLGTALVLAVLPARASLRVAGVLGSTAFQVGQSAALVALTGTHAILVYSPPLLALGVGAGWFTGLVSTWTERALRPGWIPPQDRAQWLAGALLAATLVLGYALRPTTAVPAREAVVTVAGTERFRIDLSQPQQIRLPTEDGEMLLQVEPGRLRVAFSDCPDQVCVLSSWIDRPGRPIYCAPYRVLITISGGSGEVDGVIR